MNILRAANKKQIIAWSFYDWANSAFATTVMAGFFPLFFKNYWSEGVSAAESTWRLGMANSIASLVILVLAPVLGAIADKGGAKKKFLLFFTFMGVVMTGALYFVERGAWEIAVFLYAAAAIGFSGGIVFYDSLIVDVAEEKQFDVVSALGYALGYLGGGVLFALNVAMTLWPAKFGLADSGEAVRVSFVLVAVWWAVFSIPVMLFVKEPRRVARVSAWTAVAGGVRQLAATFREVRRLRVVFIFLVAYWFYIDAVDTIIRMAVDYGLSLGLDSKSLIVALLITQFVGFPSAIAFGKLGEKWGAKTGLFIALGVYIAATLWAMTLDSEAEFYILAVVIGLVQGGVQSLSRSLYARLIPANKSAEFFGFYNMLGKFAAVMGPALMGLLGMLTGSARLSLLAVVMLLVIGAVALYFVNEDEGRRMARALE